MKENSDHVWKSRGQHESSCYQPQPANYNQFQHYCHNRRDQKAPSRNDYDWDKGGNNGNIHSGIHIPDKKYPLFHWEIIFL